VKKSNDELRENTLQTTCDCGGNNKCRSTRLLRDVEEENLGLRQQVQDLEVIIARLEIKK
jgi:hypothetical protein